MLKYKNIDGVSGIIEYQIGENFIDIKFKSGKIYKYNYNSAGVENIENMKKLAIVGEGLNSYLKRNCNDLFVK